MANNDISRADARKENVSLALGVFWRTVVAGFLCLFLYMSITILITGLTTHKVGYQIYEKTESGSAVLVEEIDTIPSEEELAEIEEKLEEKRLAVVRTVPEGESYVYADGRHLWRVIDNLLSNCAKYALEGTRVYIELVRGKGTVSLSVKNISREALNVPPERLMERFVRGEESRSTEGSGLGLSIARSLTELQGGTFELAVDGDLFKAVVTLPQSS